MPNSQVASGTALKRWLVRKIKGCAIGAAVAIPLAFAVRTTVAEVFYVPSSVAAPEVPQNSRVLVYKLGHSYRPHDIIVYRNRTGEARLGRVISATATDVTASRSGEADVTIPLRQVVGRVVLGTR